MFSLIFFAVALDLILGDPRSLPHPVVIIGKAISIIENFIRKITKSPLGLKIGGVFLLIFIVGGTYLVTYLLISFAKYLHPTFGIIFEVFILYTTISVKSLHEHAREVARPLKNKDLITARKNLGMIVGRDTDNLDEKEITRGVVETVAENTVDGIISPLFYAFLGGAPLAMAYKAVNTLDSMVGYKDERFINIGWASAKFDDVVNYIPARLSGIFFLIASLFTPQGPRACLRTIKKDASKHPSPNGGIPESAVAGSLGIKLGGLNYYFGKPSYRAEIGEEIVPLRVEHIDAVIKLMYIVTFISLFAGVLLTIIFNI